jgi:DNA-binding response OmpR family regulator
MAETAAGPWHGAWTCRKGMTRSPGVVPRRGAILVVEDRDDVRQGLAQLLEFNGFLVEEARTGAAALERLQSQDGGVALVLLDLVLPGSVSGRDIRARMLADRTHADLPTIIVTASEIDPPGRAGLCPTAWLEKPFRFDDLLDLVRRFVVPEASALAGSDEIGRNS